MNRFLTFHISLHFVAISLLLLISMGLSSCLNNDIPYPRIQAGFATFTVDGQTGETIIDNDKRTVTVELNEKTDINKVAVKQVTLTPDNAQASIPLKGEIDLSKPLNVIISLYQDYEWTIIGKQNIEYIFTVEGQIGNAYIDPINQKAVAYIGTTGDLTKVKITDLKLGPIDITNMTPNLKDQYCDFSAGSINVNVTYHNQTLEWKLFVFQRESNVTTNEAIAWVNVAWLSGEGIEGQENGFQWREASATDWQGSIPSETTSSTLSARLSGLKAETAYIYRAYSGEEYGEEIMFTTGKAIPLENGSFEYWQKPKKIWLVYGEGQEMYWDSGNHGSSTLNKNVTEPTEETYNGTGKAAQLKSQFVGLFGLGKFAAGNLFAGKYVETVGLDGILSFGRPFTSYPTKLKGYYSYTTATIDYNSNGYEEFSYLLGKPDPCFIYVALGDWEEPVTIQTSTDKTKRKLFDKKDPHIIAYAELSQGSNTNGYQPFELELDYSWNCTNGNNNRNRKPTHLVIVCSASKYGDYFTGADGATLLLDNFELEYDY